MGRAAARLTDPVAHVPPALTGGPGSPNVLIGGLPAWRGIPAAAVGPIMAARGAADAAIKASEAATLAAAGSPSQPALYAAEQTVKSSFAATNGGLITSAAAGGADVHQCATPLPVPPHGPGVVIDGSATVLINGAPAARMGDTVAEAVGPPNKIVGGCPTVLIGP